MSPSLAVPGQNVSRQSLLIIALLMALASIVGAWIFELGFGYAPCKLCLLQRWPYYIGLPIGAAAYLSGGYGSSLGRSLIVLFILTFIVSAALGAYHAGVEWKVWAGPSDCSGRLIDGPTTVLDLRKSLQTAKVVRCDDAALRVLGLSFAGWNVLVSLVVTLLAGLGFKKQS